MIGCHRMGRHMLAAMNFPRTVAGVAAVALLAGTLSCSPDGSSTGAVVGSSAPGDKNQLVGVLIGFVDDIPTALAVDSSGAVYVAERRGTIRRIRANVSPERPADLVADLTDRVGDGGTVDGLLGVALTTDGERLLANYTTKDGQLALSSFDIDADGAIDPASEHPILRVAHPHVHKGGDVEVAEDGSILVSVASLDIDGVTGLGDAQRPDGVVLRLEPSVISATSPHIPTADDIVAHGLRNPWRFSVDGGSLWVADVGESTTEEIDRADLADPPENFGWPYVEGTEVFVSVPDGLSTDAFRPPVVAYPHDEHRCAAVGGLVSRSVTAGGTSGAYLFGDFCSGDVLAVPSDKPIHATETAEPTVEPMVVGEIGRSPVAFAAGPDDEVFVAGSDGAILRLTARGQVEETDRINPPINTLDPPERTVDPASVVSDNQLDTFCRVRAALSRASDLSGFSPADARSAVTDAIAAFAGVPASMPRNFRAASNELLGAYTALRALGDKTGWDVQRAEVTRFLRLVSAERGRFSTVLRHSITLLGMPTIDGPTGLQAKECPT